MSAFDPDQSSVEESISRGIEFLRQNQLDYGEFPTYIGSNVNLDGSLMLDSNPFNSAMIAYCLSYLDDPRVEPMIAKALDFAASEMEGNGLWRFYSSRNFKHSRVPPDVDSTSFVSYVLAMFGRKFPANEQAVLSNSRNDGRFLVWFAPRSRFLFSNTALYRELGKLQTKAWAVQPPMPEQLRGTPRFRGDVDLVPLQEIDPGVQANVVLYLGESELTRPAISSIVKLIKDGAEKNSSPYYISVFSLYYVISRAFLHSAPMLGEIRDPITARLRDLQENDGSFGPALHTGFAACSLATFGSETEVFRRAIGSIVAAQEQDGSWPQYGLFANGFPSKATEYWGSREITTGVCLEALARYNCLRTGEMEARVTIASFPGPKAPGSLSVESTKVRLATIRRRFLWRIDFDPLSPEYIQDPYPHYRRLRRDAPVNNFDDKGFRTVSRYEDALFVLSKPDLFSSAGAPVFEDTLIEADSPSHERIRARLSGIFSRKAIQNLEAQIGRICDELLSQIQRKTSFDLVGDFAAHLPMWVGAGILGFPRDLAGRLTEWYKARLLRFSGRTDAEARIHASVIDSEFGSFLEEHFRRSRQLPVDDSLTHTILSMVDDRLLTFDQAVRLMKFFVVSIAETITGLLANAILALLKNPDEMQLVRSDSGLVASLVEEALRYESPAQFVQRWPTRDTEIGGIRVREGTRLIVLIGSANRDERHFDDPDRFSIKRDSRSHLAFGNGTHYCLGANLARLEAQVALRSLLFELPPFELAYPNKPVEMLQTLIVRAPARLDLVFQRR
jgi:cytochrome P450